MDNDSAHQALARVLDADPPEGLEILDAAALQELAELIGHARDRQQQQMRQALEDALSYVPAVARGTVRRILFPSGKRK